MSLLQANVLSTKQIEVLVRNDFYHGYTKQIFLRSNNTITELQITSKKKQKQYTSYLVDLDQPITLGNEYEIVIDRALRAPLNIQNIVFHPDFDTDNYYDGPLGSFYTKTHTTFYVWAPLASSVLVDIMTTDHHSITKRMIKQDKGVWTIQVDGDLELATYTYLVTNSGAHTEAFDPYAYSSTPNSKRSVIIDLDKVQPTLNKSHLPTYESFTDYIIYETSVRDFTIRADGIQHKGKFKGMTERGVTTKEGRTLGLDYLVELGITHLQLMPFYDYGSTLEEAPEMFYNWGYDPVNYNVPEGGYATDVFDPYKRITDVQEMIQSINNAGIHVNMDVVYNHMFDAYSSCFHNLVPTYYFRYDKDGTMSNGSFCGNDTESTHLMMRRFIVDSILRWVQLYGVDGFRFDLMGIHDVETMNMIRHQLDEINPMIIVYGEGWHMPSTLKDSLKASIVNQQKVPQIAMFNDRFRDTLKGPHNKPRKPGFLTGNKALTNIAASCYTGTVVGYKDVKPYMRKPTTTINYSSCHDNYTIFDQYMIKFKDPTRARFFQRFVLTNLLVSQGICFLHSGSEFFRTKQGVENSYNTSDDINHIDWSLRDKYADNVDFIKQLIQLRKDFKGYRLSTAKEVKKHVFVKAIKQGVIDYTIAYQGDTYKHLINATREPYTVSLQDEYSFVLSSNESYHQTEGISESIEIPPYSLLIVKK